MTRRFPIEIRVRTYIIIPIYLLIVSTALFKTHQPGFALLMTAILGLFFIVNHGIDWGYQFAYDDKRVYQRPKGWRWFFRRSRLAIDQLRRTHAHGYNLRRGRRVEIALFSVRVRPALREERSAG